MNSPHANKGIVINRRADVGARLVVLRDLIPAIEKETRRTPPKTLAEADARVRMARETLIRLTGERDSLLDQWRVLRASLGESTEDPY